MKKKRIEGEVGSQSDLASSPIWFDRKQQNSVKQLSFNKKNKKEKIVLKSFFFLL